jgi:hypothetical protein
MIGMSAVLRTRFSVPELLLTVTVVERLLMVWVCVPEADVVGVVDPVDVPDVA